MAVNRQVCKALTRLYRGVRVANPRTGPCELRVYPLDSYGLKWQAVLINDRKPNEVQELYEASLHILRKIVTSYYPSAARHFGPARSYARATV